MIKLTSLLEKYDKLSDLISNPDNNEKVIHQLLDDFKSNGGEILGNGKFATVLTHPSWKHVVKIFSDDIPYLKFVRFCLKNPRKSFPIFYDKPRRIIPNYKRHKSNVYLYVVRMEKLFPISIREYDDIQFYTSYDVDHAKEIALQIPDTWEFIYNKLLKLQQNRPSFPQFKLDLDFMLSHAHEIGSLDFHSKNIMKRENGELVLSDPFWVGETPYQTHDRLLKAELDYDDYDYDDGESDMIKGGEKFKKAKPKIASINHTRPDDGDIPF